MDEEKLTTGTSSGYRTLVRANNIQKGHAPQGREASQGPLEKEVPRTRKEALGHLLRAFKGWNDDGIPTKETLHDLGLDYVAEDFLERGILKEGADAPPKQAQPDQDQEV